MPRGIKKVENQYVQTVPADTIDGGPIPSPASEIKETNKDFAAFLSSLKEITKDLQVLKDDLKTLKNRVDEIQIAPSEPPSNEPKIESTQVGESAILQVVKDILGDGFETKVAPNQDGVYFQLSIIPPAQLKEHKDDRRVRVIPYLEGVSGAKEYALRVKTYCVAWAAKNGRVYQWPS
jgi:hypothetical protein